MATCDVELPVYFLQRSELWQKEKPFLLDYTPAPPAVKSNSILEHKEVVIEDLRERQSEFRFHEHGFCITPMQSALEYDDFSDDAKVREFYLPTVAAKVKEALNASRVQIYDYTIRKCDQHFPFSTGGHYAHKQPASVAHIDTTPICMDQMLKTMNEEDYEQMSKRHHQSVNVWKPLRGPVRDWPLALCSPQTVKQTDLQARDTVSKNTFIETYQLHHNPAHQWYYISQQQPDEAWLFLQADSNPSGMHGVPHASFPHPSACDAEFPRESIEVRCMVHYDSA